MYFGQKMDYGCPCLIHQTLIWCIYSIVKDTIQFKLIHTNKLHKPGHVVKYTCEMKVTNPIAFPQHCYL